MSLFTSCGGKPSLIFVHPVIDSTAWSLKLIGSAKLIAQMEETAKRKERDKIKLQENRGGNSPPRASLLYETSIPWYPNQTQTL